MFDSATTTARNEPLQARAKMVTSGPALSFDRFIWAQAFASRLAELGAPLGADLLIELGTEAYETSHERDPAVAAEWFWSHWLARP